MYEYGYWHDHYWHTGAFFDIVFLLLVLFGVACLVQYLSKCPPEDNKRQDRAIDTLKKRYAAGEINVEEFTRMKKDLEA